MSHTISWSTFSGKFISLIKLWKLYINKINGAGPWLEYQAINQPSIIPNYFNYFIIKHDKYFIKYIIIVNQTTQIQILNLCPPPPDLSNTFPFCLKFKFKILFISYFGSQFPYVRCIVKVTRPLIALKICARLVLDILTRHELTFYHPIKPGGTGN